jgi:hypothetical protein
VRADNLVPCVPQTRQLFKNDVVANVNSYMDTRCGHILCEFEIVRYKNINKVSIYAQSLKQCQFNPMTKLVSNYAICLENHASSVQNTSV